MEGWWANGGTAEGRKEASKESRKRNTVAEKDVGNGVRRREERQGSEEEAMDEWMEGRKEWGKRGEKDKGARGEVGWQE